MFVQNGTLQTEFPFTGRIPQIGTEVPQTDKVKRPQLCTPEDLPKCWRVCHDVPNTLFLIFQELMSSQSRSPSWHREGKKVPSRQKKASAASRSTSPPFSTAASEFCSREGGSGVIGARPCGRESLVIWPQRNPPTLISPVGGWCGERFPSLRSSQGALQGHLPMRRSWTSP